MNGERYRGASLRSGLSMRHGGKALVRGSNGGAGYIGSHKVSSARRQASVQLTAYLIPILAERTQNAQSFQWSPPIKNALKASCRQVPREYRFRKCRRQTAETSASSRSCDSVASLGRGAAPLSPGPPLTHGRRVIVRLNGYEQIPGLELARTVANRHGRTSQAMTMIEGRFLSGRACLRARVCDHQ